MIPYNPLRLSLGSDLVVKVLTWEFQRLMMPPIQPNLSLRHLCIYLVMQIMPSLSSVLHQLITNYSLPRLAKRSLVPTQKVVSQPNTGSLYKSQNSGIWTEDKSEDITFILHRANFKSNFTSNLRLVNEPLPLRLLPCDPIETCNTESLFPPRTSNPNSDNWEENSKIVKIYHPNHGLRTQDMVSIEGVDGGSTRSIGGINVDNINTLHQVISADLDNFTIKVIQAATSSVKGGGKKVMGSCNRAYETINLYSGIQTFPSSTLFATNVATEAAGVTQYNIDKQYRPSVVEDIPIMDTFYYDGAKQVASYPQRGKIFQL